MATPVYAEALAEFLAELLNHHNYQPPIFLAAIEANGNLIYVRRYTGGLDYEHHSEGSGLQYPIHLVGLEAGTGRMAKETIPNDGQRPIQ